MQSVRVFIVLLLLFLMHNVALGSLPVPQSRHCSEVFQEFSALSPSPPRAGILSVASVSSLSARWSPAVRANDAASAQQLAPSLAAHANSLYVAWQDHRSDADIYVARSADGGRTWSAGVRVNDLIAPSQFLPSLAAAPDGTLYVAWEDNRAGNTDIFFARSTDGGRSWSSNVKVNDDAGTASQFTPNLAVEPGGAVAVVWQDTRRDPVTGANRAGIYAARSVDGGRSWSRNTRVNDNRGDAGQFYPSLAASGAALYVAWEDRRTGDSDIYFARSTDGGQSWSRNLRINDDLAMDEQLKPRVASGANNQVYLVWQDRRESKEGIYFARSEDRGQNWSPNTRINHPSFDAAYPALLARPAGALYAAWCEQRNLDDAIYSIVSVDGGRSWETAVRVDIDTASTRQNMPALALDGDGDLYASWWDERGAGDIYAASRLTDIRFIPLARR